MKVPIMQTLSPRWSAASRVLAGTLGAYTLAALVTVALSLVLASLGIARAEAATAATLASYAVFAGIAMAVFHAQSASKAWRGLVLTGLPLALGIWLLMPSR